MKLNLPIWLPRFLQICLALLFLYSGGIKIFQPMAFARALYNYHLLPDSLLYPVAVVLPYLEFVTGFLLLIDRLRLAALDVAIILLAVFTLAVASALVRGLDISCGCFSLAPDGRHVSVLKILENLVLIAVAIYLRFFAAKVP